MKSNTIYGAERFFQIKGKRLALDVVFRALPKRAQNSGMSVEATKLLRETELPLESETLLASWSFRATRTRLSSVAPRGQNPPEIMGIGTVTFLGNHGETTAKPFVKKKTRPEVP